MFTWSYKQLLTVLMARMTRTKRDVTVLSVSRISTHSGMNIMSGSLLVWGPLAQKGECVPVQPLHGSGAEYRLCMDVFVNLCNLDFRTAGFGDFIYRRQNTGSWTKTGDCRSNTGVPPPGCFLEEACETFSAGRSIWAVANREISGHDSAFLFLHWSLGDLQVTLRGNFPWREQEMQVQQVQLEDHQWQLQMGWHWQLVW